MAEPQRREDEDQHVQPDHCDGDDREQHDGHHRRHPQQRRRRAQHADGDADAQQRQPVALHDDAALVGGGMLGQRVVGHHAVGQPAPQQRRDQREERRDQPQRQRDDGHHGKHQRAAQRMHHAAEHRAALAALQQRIAAIEKAHHGRHRGRTDEHQDRHDDHRHQHRDHDQRREHGAEARHAQAVHPAVDPVRERQALQHAARHLHHRVPAEIEDRPPHQQRHDERQHRHEQHARMQLRQQRTAKRADEVVHAEIGSSGCGQA